MANGDSLREEMALFVREQRQINQELKEFNREQKEINREQKEINRDLRQDFHELREMHRSQDRWMRKHFQVHETWMKHLDKRLDNFYRLLRP